VPVVERFGDLLHTLQRESITKSYKLVTLPAFVELGGLAGGIPVPELASRSRYIMRTNPRLVGDAGDHLHDSDDEWYQYWRQWPIAAWTGELRQSSVSAVFEVVDDRFRLRTTVPDHSLLQFERLLGELVDYRLCRYLDVTEARVGEWRLRVGQTAGRPLVWLDRPRNPGLPEGAVDVMIEGRQYVGLFRKIALNKVHEPPSEANLLPTLLSTWFGADAGVRGTAQNVVIRRDSSGWELAPDTDFHVPGL
jgi:hypothetical protein